MPMLKRNFRSVYTKPTLLSYEQSRRHSLGSSWVHSECARYASSLSLRLVWKQCPGRGSAANAKNVSTPPLDTGNIGFEPPTGIGNSTRIVPVGVRKGPVSTNSEQAPTQNCQGAFFLSSITRQRKGRYILLSPILLRHKMPMHISCTTNR